jgi:hypothetical protein
MTDERQKAIEDAARVAESEFADTAWNRTYTNAGLVIAAKIRALASAPQDSGEKRASSCIKGGPIGCTEPTHDDDGVAYCDTCGLFAGVRIEGKTPSMRAARRASTPAPDRSVEVTEEEVAAAVEVFASKRQQCFCPECLRTGMRTVLEQFAAARARAGK